MGWEDVVGDIVGTGIEAWANRDSAQDQMHFQQFMSNTAHFREMKDLYRAGLNPILSARYGGASTPGGAGYSISKPDIMGAYRQGNLVSAQTENIKQDTAKKEAEAKNVSANTKYLEGAQTEKTLADAFNSNMSGYLSSQQIQNLTEQIPLIRQQIDLAAAQTRQSYSSAQSVDYENEARRIESELYKEFPILKQLDTVGRNATVGVIKDTLMQRFSWRPPAPASKTYKDSRGNDVRIDYQQ